MTLQDLTRELIALRKKPSTPERWKAYPQLLQDFVGAVADCEEVATLREVIALDSGYYLLAGYRQKVLEKWLALDRSAEALRLYAMQLMLFGDVDDWGNAETALEERIESLEREADAKGA